MKNLIPALFLAALCASACFANEAPKPAAPAPDPVSILTKDRDEARAQVAQMQAQANQSAIVTEYYKALAEKNQAILQAVSLNQQLEQANARANDLQAKYDLEKAKVEELLKKAGGDIGVKASGKPEEKK